MLMQTLLQMGHCHVYAQLHHLGLPHTHRNRQLPIQNRPTNPREWSTILSPTQGSKDTALAIFGKLLRDKVECTWDFTSTQIPS